MSHVGRVAGAQTRWELKSDQIQSTAGELFCVCGEHSEKSWKWENCSVVWKTIGGKKQHEQETGACSQYDFVILGHVSGREHK